MTEKRLRPEGVGDVTHPSPGQGIPGAQGPTAYPKSPEGGVEGDPGYTPLPGGTNRVPAPASDDVTAQQGAGSGSGGLTPNPGTPSDGTIQTGWKGGSYSATTDVSGDNGSFPVPSGFTGL